MIQSDVLSQRIDALEMRAMHQERTIEDLNTTITLQWRQIDLMARQVTELTERLRESSTQVGAEPPPPHY